MVEKIDRPEVPQLYQITRPKDTKEDQHQQQNPRENIEREYQKQLAGESKEWSKFGQRTRTIKPLRVARDRIDRCLFKNANLHSGIGILQVDVHWKDKRVTRDALMLITRLEDFIKLKRLAPGKPVPEELWARGPVVEMGIVQVADAGGFPGQEYGARPAQQVREQAPKVPLLLRAGILKPGGKGINWGLVMMYALLAALLVFAAVVLIV